MVQYESSEAKSAYDGGDVVHTGTIHCLRECKRLETLGSVHRVVESNQVKHSGFPRDQRLLP